MVKSFKLFRVDLGKHIIIITVQKLEMQAVLNVQHTDDKFHPDIVMKIKIDRQLKVILFQIIYELIGRKIIAVLLINGDLAHIHSHEMPFCEVLSQVPH